MNRDDQNVLLENLSAILIRCFFLSIALLLVSFIFFLLTGNTIYCLHSRWFDFEQRDYDLLFYYGMAFIKICAFVFFLFPYIAIRLVLRKSKRREEVGK
jgi:heme/copper-type cytochrome/quinol oxidase subunit 2